MRPVLATLASIATVAGLLVTAVVAAPAAQATTGVTRLQVQNVQSSTIDVTNPAPGSSYKRYTDARYTSVPMTVTFAGGTASFTVNGGTAIPLTSGVAVDVPIDTGITPVVVTFNDGNVDSTYSIDIKRPWLIDGYEIYDAADLTTPLARFHVDDGNFDPLSFTPTEVNLPHDVTGIRWKTFYQDPAGIPVNERWIWIHGAPDCVGYDCASGELTQVWTPPIGTWQSGGPATQVASGTGYDYFSYTYWPVKITRAGAYSADRLTNVSAAGVTLSEVGNAAYTYRGLVPAASTSINFTATFPSGAAAFSVDGGASTPITSGTPFAVPVNVGGTSVTIDHTGAEGVTTYTYRLARAHPITGIEVADAVTGDILFSKTGSEFDPTLHQHAGYSSGSQHEINVPYSVASVKFRMFYDTPPAGYTGRWWIHNWTECEGECESGEWSRSVNLNVGVRGGGGPLSMCTITDACTYGDWSYWSIQITRASETVSVGSASITGTPQAGEMLRAEHGAPSATPSATVSYQWQSADSAEGPWSNIVGATSRWYRVQRAVVGKVVRVVVTGANGISTPGVAQSSATSTVASAPLAAPTQVTVVPGDGELTVRWRPPADPDYIDSAATATSGSGSASCTGVSECTIRGLANGTTYAVTVVANAGTGAGAVTSPASTSVSAVPAVPTAPGLDSVEITGSLSPGQRLRAVLTNATGTPGPSVTYVWERSATGTSNWQTIVGATRSSLFVGEASIGQFIRVRATAATGVSPAVTRTSAVVGPIADITEVQPDWILDATVPGSDSRPRDVAFDSQGYMYVITGWNTGTDSIVKYAPDATENDVPLAVWSRGEDGTALWGAGIAVDSQDNVWVADHNFRLWKLPAGASAADRPQLKADNIFGRPFGITVDRNDYIYVTESATVRVYSPSVSLGDAPLRTISIGEDARDLAIAEDGSLIVASGTKLRFYAPGPTGSSTPIRSITSSSYCTHFYGIAVDADGRIYNNHHHCRNTYVYNPNAVDSVAPIRVLETRNDYGGMGTNPLTGNVYLAGYDRREIMSWDRSGLALGPVPTPGVPQMTTVTTALTGEAAVRGALSGSYSGLTGLPAPTLSLGWQIADSASGEWSFISGQTGSSLDIAPAYQGKYLRFAVTVTNVNGSTTTTSTPVGPIAPRPARGVDRWITGAAMNVQTITDIEFLPGDRIAAMSQWASDNRIQVFGPTADGNAAPVQSISLPLNGFQSGWGVNVAPDGGIWAAYHGGWAVKVPGDANGSPTPTRTLNNSLAYARSLVEDANGYVYVGLHESQKVKVFAPGATTGAEPIRVLDVWNRGLSIDIDGNLLVASNGFLNVYEPGASANLDPIKQIAIGTGWDVGVDAQKRIWVLADGKVKVFNPKVSSSSVPVLEITNDWATRLSGITAIGVSKETEGLFAIANETSIQTYDYSTLLPPVPAEAAPTIGSATITGDASINLTLTASAGNVSSYPDATITYQWQRADSAAGPWTPIVGATGSTYIPGAGDSLKILRVVATATNSIDSASVASAVTARLGYASVKTPVSYLSTVQHPWAMHLLPSGNLLVANRGQDVREFAAGAAFADAPIRRISAAGYTGPAGVFQDSSGFLWINYEGQNRVVKLAGDAQRNATPLQVFNPGCTMHAKVVVDSAGFIYVPCWHEGMVKVFAPDATGDATPLRTISNTSYARAELGPDGVLTVVGNNYVRTYELGGASASTTPLTDKASSFHLTDVAWDDAGNIILAGGGLVRAYPQTSTTYSGGDFVMDGLQRLADVWSLAYDSVNDRLIVGNYHGMVTVYDWAAALRGDPVAPSRPTALQATADDGIITGNWTPPSETYTAVEMYADAGQGVLKCIASAPVRTCSITTADGLVNGRQYRVWTRAFNESAPSGDSDSVYVTPRDPEPAGLTSVTLSGSSVAGQLIRSSLQGLTGFPAPTLTYVWQVRDDAQSAWTAIAGASSASFFVDSALVGKEIRLRVTAETRVGGPVSRNSDPIGPITTTLDASLVNIVEASGPWEVAVDGQGNTWVGNIDRGEGVPGNLVKFAPGATGADAPVATWMGNMDRGTSAITFGPDDRTWFGTWDGRVFTLPADATSDDVPTRFIGPLSTVIYGLAVDAAGYVYVSADSLGEVRVYDSSAQLVRTIPVATPRGLLLAPSGELLIVTDSRVFSVEAGPNGSNRLTPRVTEAGCSNRDVALDADGRIYLSQGWCNRVAVFKANSTEGTQPLFYMSGEGTRWNETVGLSMAADGRSLHVGSFHTKSVNTFDTRALTFPAADPISAPTISTATLDASENYFYGTLRAQRTGITGNPAPQLIWQWERSTTGTGAWSDIPGATESSYAITPEDVGKYLRARTEASNSEGSAVMHTASSPQILPAPARSRIQEISGQQAGIGAAHGIAVDAAGRIYVGNAWGNNISVFAADANGNVPPLARMTSSRAGGSMWGVFVDTDGDVWGGLGNGHIAEFDATSDGTVEPKRVLTPANRPGGCELRDIAVGANGFVYASCHSQNVVLVYAPDADASALPVRTILARGAFSLGLLPSGELLVGTSDSIGVFEPGASTNNRPIRRIESTGFVFGIDADAQGRIYSLNRGGEVLVYSPAAQGGSAPLYRLVRDAATNLGDNASLAVDRGSGKLYVGRVSDQAVNVYDLGSVLPAVPSNSLPTVGALTIAGEARPAAVVSAQLPTVTGYPDPRVTVQWQWASSASGPWTDIANAVGTNYMIGADRAGDYLRATVTAENSVGRASSDSEAIGPIAFAPVRAVVSALRGPRTGIEHAWNVISMRDGRTAVVSTYRGVTVYAAGATNNAEPVQTIQTATPGVSTAWGLAEGPQGTIVVSYRSSHIEVYASNADGVVTALRTISTSCSGQGVAVDADGLIYNACSDRIEVFAADATGQAAPVRTITGVSAYDLEIMANGRLLVGTNTGIRVYEAGINGSNAPLQSIERGCEFWGVASDAAGRILGAARCGALEIFPADANGSAEPLVRITGDGWTHISDTTGLAVSSDGLAGLASSGSHQVTWYDIAELIEGDPTIPNPVTNLRATPGDYKFTVNWDASPGEVTHYEVTVTGGSSTMSCTTRTTSCVFDWNDGVRADIDYSISVMTVRRTATATSGTITVQAERPENERPPGKVTGVTAVGINDTITVSWTAPSGVITGYRVTARSGDTVLTCRPAEPTERTCNVTGAEIGLTYTVRVVAEKYDMSGAASDAVSVTVIRRDPPVISAVTITGEAKSQQQVTSADAVATGFPEPTIRYQWQSAASQSGPWVDLVDEETTSLFVRNRDVGRFLRLRVTADNGVGDPVRRFSNVLGPVLNVAGGTETRAKPMTWDGAVAGDGRVTLSWNNLRGATTETFTISITAGSNTQTVVVPSTTLSRTITGLRNGTTYTFRVQATGLDESASPALQRMPIGKLGRIVGLRAQVRGTTLTLTWTRPTGTSPVSGYRVVLDSATRGAPDREISVETTRATVTRLVSGASYRISITARNTLGPGAVFTQPRPTVIP